MTTYVYRGNDRLDSTALSDAGRGEVCHGVRGTHAGYWRHRKAAEKPCEKCRQAYNAYRRAWRASNNEAQKATVAADMRARTRAWRALARRHPVEYAALLRAELAEVAQELAMSSPGDAQ